MRFFRVGGCVRDRLLGGSPVDIDYCVTGATEDEFLKSKPFSGTYKKVGADFPVFLDQNDQEWALARLERKTGEGYHGFSIDASKKVTIEDDLARRDLTINAMAIEIFDDMKTRLVEIIDPFGGQEDIQNKILRHTTEAFSEDPVRVLRLARFRARLGKDWTVAPETKILVSKMAKSGVLSELNPDRVWKELKNALMENYPRLFFDTLLECDALHVIFPEVYRLKTALESRRWHPEGDAYEHTMLVLTQAVRIGGDLETRLACLVHDFGKGITPRDKLPSHFKHEVTGVAITKDFCNRLRVPVKIRDNIMKTTRYHMHMHKLDIMNAKTFIKMFEQLNNDHVIHLLWRVGVCDDRGRLGSENSDVSGLYKIVDIFDAYKTVKFADVFPNGETAVNKIKDGLYRARIAAIKNM